MTKYLVKGYVKNNFELVVNAMSEEHAQKMAIITIVAQNEDTEEVKVTEIKETDESYQRKSPTDGIGERARRDRPISS